jgi:hypothetical protein
MWSGAPQRSDRPWSAKPIKSRWALTDHRTSAMRIEGYDAIRTATGAHDELVDQYV